MYNSSGLTSELARQINFTAGIMTKQVSALTKQKFCISSCSFFILIISIMERKSPNLEIYARESEAGESTMSDFKQYITSTATVISD